MTIVSIIFWISLGIPLYVYVGFPILIMIVGTLRARHVRKQPITPTVSLIIAAYNEEDIIAERLKNALSMDYPSEALEIIVASDGSDDCTASVVGSYGAQGVVLLELPRQGKIHALDAAVNYASGELLVFSDANTFFDAHALRLLVRNFADPTVGGVAGRKIYGLQATNDSSSQGEHLYWSYDMWLKSMESLTGSIISADGAIYAIRRGLYRLPAHSAVTDDFALSTAVIEQGYRLVFEHEACAHEMAISEADREFWRKVRLMTRGLRAVMLRKHLLNPWHFGFYAIILFSHKVLRRLVPIFLLVLLATSVVASSSGMIYVSAALIQTFFYSLAGIGYILRGTFIGRKKYFYIPFYYCLANLASLIAVVNTLRGKHIYLWSPQRHGI